VMSSEPFVSHASQEKISPDEEALPHTRKKCMGAAGDGKNGRRSEVVSSSSYPIAGLKPMRP
jgi:hypothetical protein